MNSSRSLHRSAVRRRGRDDGKPQSTYDKESVSYALFAYLVRGNAGISSGAPPCSSGPPPRLAELLQRRDSLVPIDHDVAIRQAACPQSSLRC